MRFRNPKDVLSTLVFVHVAVGLSAGIVFDPALGRLVALQYLSTSLVIFVAALAFCQSSLLGFWGGLGANKWTTRLFGVIAGLVYLEWLAGLRVGLLGIAVIPTAVTAGAFLMARRFVTVALPTSVQPTARHERQQFSIRHLMLLMLFVGCALGIGKWLYPLLQPTGEITSIVVFCLSYALLGIAAVWGMLGSPSPILGGAVVLSLPVLMSVFLTSLSGHKEFFVLALMTRVSDAVFLMASLFVVRLCGYRLMRIKLVAP